MWNDPQRKKTLIPVMFEKGYKADGWLGIIMGTKLYYNMHNQDEIERSLPGLVGEVEAAHGVDAGKLDGLKLGGGAGRTEVSMQDMEDIVTDDPVVRVKIYDAIEARNAAMGREVKSPRQAKRSRGS